MSELKVHQIVIGQLATNCYFVYDLKSNRGVIIDPGDAADYVIDQIQRLNFRPVSIIATHGHFDHVMAAFEIQKTFKIPFLIHPADEFLLKNLKRSADFFLGYNVDVVPPSVDGHLSDGFELKIVQHTLKIIHTPGHTPGSVCIFYKDWVITGDTLFANGAYGRTDFSYSSQPQLYNSLARLWCLPLKLIIYPGHGEISNLKTEYNQFNRLYHKLYNN